MKIRYSNLQQVFISTRIFSLTFSSIGVGIEPFAYEGGFAAQKVIRAQANEMENGTIHSLAGSLSYSTSTAPWVNWGPYLWANGTMPRSTDNFQWSSADLESDLTHPSTVGETKAANELMTFFLGSPYTTWFRD